MTTSQQALGMSEALEKRTAYLDQGLWPSLVRTWSMNNSYQWLVLLEAGTMALVTQGAREGDELWMLFGNPYPVILRERKGKYMVVGTAVMDYVKMDEVNGALGAFKEGDGMCFGRDICHIDLI
jgi:hypothetical protein